MGKQGKDGIKWTDFTFSVWWGCTKVSEGCKECYAAEMGNRFGVKWGKGQARRHASEKMMGEPIRWNKAAAKNGTRPRVFCGSMMDWADQEVDPAWRKEMWDVIRKCTSLEWLMLTKRVNDIPAALPPDWGEGWDHVRLGCTVENQAMADFRIPKMKKIPHRLPFFLSMEPLLERVTLDYHLGREKGMEWADCLCKEIDPSDAPCIVCECRKELGKRSGIGQIIAGGESGRSARPCALEWIELLVEEAAVAGIPAFVKQLGTFCVSEERRIESPEDIKAQGAHPDGWAWRMGHGAEDPKGGDIDNFPAHLQVRQPARPLEPAEAP